MGNKTNEYINKMYDSCKKKCDLLSQMLELTQNQTEVIKSEDTDELLAIIDAKQKKIDEINTLDEIFNAELQKLKGLLKVESLDEVSREKLIVDSIFLNRLKDVIKDIVLLSEKIAEVEKVNNESANAVYKELSEKIKDINKGKKLKSAYTGNNDTSAVYFDKKK